MSLIPVINNICNKRWGWHFSPKKDMNYGSDKWYEKQNMVLSFESKLDLILVKLKCRMNTYAIRSYLFS